jgi:FkbM family methyltransferase
MLSNSIHSIFQQFNKLTKHLRLWEKNSKTIIYGAGNIGQDVYRVLKNNGIDVIGFLDQKVTQICYWEGVPIINPHNHQLSFDKIKKINVIVAIHNRDVEIPPIINMLKSLGFEHIITLIEFYDEFGKEMGERFWLTSRIDYLPFQSVIEEAFDIWEDEASKNLYKSILEFRLTGEYNILPKPNMGHQYFPLDLPEWKKPVRFIDCGAFVGDTLSCLIKNDIPIESIAAFEPDQENFKKLSNFVSNNLNKLKNTALWPCGVYSSTCQMHFTSGKGEASLLTTKGNSVIQCLSLDEVIPDFAPNLIKMDIEGAEYEALLGARNIIT